MVNKKEHKFIDFLKDNLELMCLIFFGIGFLFLMSLSVFENYNIANICRSWDENSDREEVITDDTTKEEWVKCCYQRVNENGVIKACEYIKLK